MTSEDGGAGMTELADGLGQDLQPADKPLDLVEVPFDVVPLVRHVVEVDVHRLHAAEVESEFGVAAFPNQCPHKYPQVPVSIVRQTPRVGLYLEGRGDRVPTRPQGLLEVVFGEMIPGLAQVFGAELAVVVGLGGGHAVRLAAPTLSPAPRHLAESRQV